MTVDWQGKSKSRFREIGEHIKTNDIRIRRYLVVENDEYYYGSDDCLSSCPVGFGGFYPLQTAWAVSG